MRKAYYFACVIFFLILLGSAITKMRHIDPAQRPSMHELADAASEFPLGKPIKRESWRKIDRQIYFGYLISSHYDAGAATVGGIYDTYASNRGLHEKADLSSGKNYRKIFCLQSLAIDVEARPARSGSSVDVGVYWSSVPGDVRYCRQSDDMINTDPA